MIFKDPWILLLLPLVLAVFFFTKKNYNKPGFIFPSDEAIKNFRESLRIKLIQKLVYLRGACIVLVIIAMARPMLRGEAEIRREGIGIVLAIDCSSTMLAEDINLKLTEKLDLLGKGFKASDDKIAKAKRINRMDASREVAREFIKNRPDDLIGIVAFAAEAFVVCPMTLDHEWAAALLDRVKGGLINDGTAIGSAILSGLNQLKETKAKTRVIVLLTDGINNFGSVSPMIAAKAARSMGVKIYAIGIVSGEFVPYPVKDSSGRITYKNVRIGINKGVLEKISGITGGRYFPATDMNSLKESYEEISRLEKSGIDEKRYEEYRDIFWVFASLALALLLLEIVLSNTSLRKIP